MGKVIHSWGRNSHIHEGAQQQNTSKASEGPATRARARYKNLKIFSPPFERLWHRSRSLLHFILYTLCPAQARLLLSPPL
jgi:hypothetical protein